MQELPRNTRSRDLSDEQNARLREVVKRELAPLIPKQYHLAKLLGMAQGNLSAFLDGTKGASASLALPHFSCIGRSKS
jgi:hypothetical protein